MTTEKWQLYSQTGVDGPEYGIRIGPGYVVVGFQKEDAQAIVAWQNASIQPEGDIMEKAKALCEDLKDGDDDYAEEREIIGCLVTEVERLRSDWRQEHATAETWKEDFKKMQKRLTDSELLRQAQYNQIAAKDARIKELEAQLKEIEEYGDCLTAAYMLGGKKKAEENKVLIDYVKRLEAAFLDHLAARLYYEYYPGVSDAYSWHDYPEDACQMHPKKMFRQKAREALEKIRAGEGGRDE